jgi:hypothetical protein
VFNAAFSNIPAISWRPVLVVEEAGVPLVKSLRNYLHKGYNLTTIIDYLKQVLIANK